MIDVSVVTGTYNRLDSLKRMVESVRKSVGDFAYEIVLVDGGSNDGTIEWCKNQPDIRLIEQGELLGAVRAFNAGAVAARGRYVILANDDIFFIDESILRAISFMEDHPTIGVGCFYQNRNEQDWHIEQMPAVDPSGQPCSAFYGQVCIVPKWLGDKLGWWGNYLHTYGGDNELSSNAWEAGYVVYPLECCCIADMMINDGLRSINGGDPMALARQGRAHPDSVKWRDKWTRDGMTGPRIHTKPKYIKHHLKRRMRILYAPIFEPGNRIQRHTKRGLWTSLAKRSSVFQFDYIDKGIDALFDYADAWQPDMFVFQIQNVGPFDVNVIRQLKQAHPEAIFVNWNGDYHPDNFLSNAYMDMMKEMHLVGLVTTQVEAEYNRRGIKWFYWQIGYEESDAQPDVGTPKHDVVYLGNGYTEKRLELGKFLLSLREEGVNVGLYGIWPKGMSSGQNLYDFDSGQKLYLNAKLAISTQQYPEGIGFVSNRMYQALAAGGALVLQQEFPGMELTGLNDDHMDVWSDFDELKEAIHFWLDASNEKERAKIAKRGNEYTLKHFSFDRRVDELFDELSRHYPDSGILRN